MTARATRFRQADVTRALRGAIAAGQRVARAEIDPNGKIVIVFGAGAPVSGNEWDEVLR